MTPKKPQVDIIITAANPDAAERVMGIVADAVDHDENIGIDKVSIKADDRNQSEAQWDEWKRNHPEV